MSQRRKALLGLVVLGLAGCGGATCRTDSDCPPSFSCVDDNGNPGDGMQTLSCNQVCTTDKDCAGDGTYCSSDGGPPGLRGICLAPETSGDSDSYADNDDNDTYTPDDGTPTEDDPSDPDDDDDCDGCLVHHHGKHQAHARNALQSVRPR